MTYPQDISKDTYVETSRFPAQQYQIILSGIMLVFSSIAILTLINTNNAVEGGIAVLITGSIVFLTIGFPQFFDFKKMKKEILSKGQSTRQRKTNINSMVGLGLGSILLIMLLGPFFLLFLATSAVWFGSVLGMIVGLSSAQLSFMLYARRWEDTNRIRLKRFMIWSYGERKKRVVLEYGVRAEKI